MNHYRCDSRIQPSIATNLVFSFAIAEIPENTAPTDAAAPTQYSKPMLVAQATRSYQQKLKKISKTWQNT